MPIRPYKLSAELIALIHKLGVTEADIRPLLDQAEKGTKEGSELTTKLYMLVNLPDFAKLVVAKGYDSIYTIEDGHGCVGVFNPGDIKAIDNLKPTNNTNINKKLILKEDQVSPAEKEKKEFDYGTDAVVNDDIFDTKQTGMSFYDQAIPGNKEYQYMLDSKNLKGVLVDMTPQEYFERCAWDIFRKGNTDDLKQQRGADKDYINHLSTVITQKKEKFPLTVLDYSDNSQEGLHRMYVAGELFGWNHKFPVLVIDWADKKKHEDQVNNKRKTNIQYNIEDALNATLRWDYPSIDQFKEALQDNINQAFLGYQSGNQPFTLSLEGDKIKVTVEDVTVEEESSKLKLRNRSTNEGLVTRGLMDKNRVTELNNIVKDKFGSQFFTTDTPQDGPCYLLPDGKFFYYGNADTYQGYLVHNMETEYLVDTYKINNDEAKVLNASGQLWPNIQAEYTFMLNDGYYRSEECVIRLLTVKPTNAQFNQLKEWIEHLQTEPSFEGQLQVTTWSYWRAASGSGYQIYDMKDENVDAEYIMNKIKWFYSSGKLLA